MLNKITLSSCLFILIIGCKSQPVDLSQAPEGYSNNTTLKLAMTTGAIKLIETKFPIPENIKEYKDVVYKTQDSMALKLDIYHSKDIKKDAPLIIFIHGGSWKKGKKHDYLVYLISFAKKGYVTATIQYRLTDVAKYPAQLHDVEDAVRWLKNNASDYNIDPNKVALVGGSAGGHLAMMSAYSNTPEDVDENGISANVQGLVNFYGPTNLAALNNAASVQYLIGKTYEEAPELYKKASPLFSITKDAPPTITFQGTLDELVPYQQSDILHKTLEDAGAVSYYHKLEGWPHAMDVVQTVNDYCQYHMDRFFEKYIPIN